MFLVLAAQYESLTLPLAVILIVPMCLVASIVGVVLRGQDNNILTQVGFVVLIGLAAKNAILIVAPSSPSRWKSAARIDGATMIDLTGPPAEPTAQKAKRIAPPPWRSPLPYRKR